MLGLCLQLAFSALAEGPKREFTKSINREFGTIANGMTAMYNKYGKMNVNTWQNNSVKIDITIVVNASDERAAERIFDRIKINFTSTSGYIKAETMIDPDQWWSNNNCQDFKINYDVWMPAGNQLDLKNKYGNAYVGALSGKLMAEVKYGDLRTEAISADADLNIGYGKANLAKVYNLSGQISYGGLTIGEVRDAQIDTKYSEMNIDRAGTLRITSRYDNFVMGNLTELRLQTKYSNLKLQNTKSLYITAQYTDVNVANVSEMLDADLNYGGMKIGLLGRNFSSVNIVGKYTDVQVYTERGANFRFDAEGSYTGIHYPAAATIRHHNDSSNHESVEGYMGDPNAKSLVKARLSYGGFVLK